MDASIIDMLRQMIAASEDTRRAAEEFGTSLIPVLPFGVGSEVTLHSGARIKVVKIKFELGAYMSGGKWHPGYRATGTQLIGQTVGSVSATAVFNLSGERVTLTQI